MELLKVMEDWKGYQSSNEVTRPENYEQKLKEAVDLLANANRLPPHRRAFLIREALTTSDFPLLFADVLDRQVLAAYKATPPVWKQFVKLSTLPDFKIGKRFAITGGDQHLEEVGEKGEYPLSDRDEAKFDLQAKKYGRQFDISWEAIINDDLGALQDTPQRFVKAAQRTEHRIVTALYANDAGTHGDGNLYEDAINMSDALLTIGNVENGVEAMAGFQDAGGEPILNRPKFLVVPPALEFTGRQILTSAQKMWIDQAGGATPTAMPMTNVIANYGLVLVIDPYLPILDDVNGNTGWYLFADPGDIAAIEFAHLKGHETPEICMKASDKVAVGGALMSAMSGDFASDNILYRVRVCAGACKLDWRATYMGGSVER